MRYQAAIGLLLSLFSLPNVVRADAQKIDIGGRKLTIFVQGTGGPTVVIEPGLGAPVVEDGQWKAVCDEIAKTNRVVLYDRAGLGTSDPATNKPRTSADVARDLHALLTNAKIAGPYVLLGHSIGGLNVRVFAGMYPKDVAGVVLVDSTCPDQDQSWLKVFPAARDGENPEITKAREFLTARVAHPADNPENYDFLASSAEARSAGTLGNKPLAILTHNPNWKMVPTLPDDISKQLEGVWTNLQNQLAKLSTNSTHQIAQHAGHGIHVEEPGLVIKAIREVVAKVKADSAH